MCTAQHVLCDPLPGSNYNETMDPEVAANARLRANVWQSRWDSEDFVEEKIARSFFRVHPRLKDWIAASQARSDQGQ